MATIMKINREINNNLNFNDLESLDIFETMEGYIFMKIECDSKYAILDLEDGCVYWDVDNYNIKRIIDAEISEKF